MRYCECGCGGTTKSRFVPGHDAKLKSRLLQAMKAGDESAMNELVQRGWMRVGEQTTFYYRPSIDLPQEVKNTAEDEIMDKVAKIIALQMNAGTQEEAEAAAAMASKIAFKYDLDLQAIREGVQSGTGARTKKIIKGMIELGQHKPWVVDLLNVVARSNFCRIVLHGSSRVSVIGERHNLLICDYMLSFLRREIDRLAGAGWDNVKHWEYTSAQGWKNAFREGAVSGVETALSRQRKQDVEENVGGLALVVLKDKEVENALGEFFPRLRMGKSRSVNTGAGYMDGYNAGKSIQMNKGVNGAREVAGRLPNGQY